MDLAYRYAKQAVNGTPAMDAAFLIERDCLTPLGDAGPMTAGNLSDFSYIAGEYGFAEYENGTDEIRARCEAEARQLCLLLVRDFESGNPAK